MAVAHLAVTNIVSSEALELLWVDGSGAETRYLCVPPGETCTQSSFAEHTWRVHAAGDGPVLATVTCGSVDAHVTALPRGAAEDGASDALELTLSNETDREVELLWCERADGAADDERSYLRVQPGETRTQRTFAEHAWRCRGAADGALLATVVLGRAGAHVRLGPLGRTPPPPPPPPMAAPRRHSTSRPRS